MFFFAKMEDAPKSMVYMKTPLKMDGLGVSLFQETSMCLKDHHQGQETRGMPGISRRARIR